MGFGFTIVALFGGGEVVVLHVVERNVVNFLREVKINDAGGGGTFVCCRDTALAVLVALHGQFGDLFDLGIDSVAKRFICFIRHRRGGGGGGDAAERYKAGESRRRGAVPRQAHAHPQSAHVIRSRSLL